MVPELRELSNVEEMGDLITFFKFLNHLDDTDSEQFFRQCSIRVTIGPGKKIVRKSVSKDWFNVMNKLTGETVNAGSLQWCLLDGSES